jgi:hypothetical protein
VQNAAFSFIRDFYCNATRITKSAHENTSSSGEVLLGHARGLLDWGGSPREEAETQPDDGRICYQTGERNKVPQDIKCCADDYRYDGPARVNSRFQRSESEQ